MLVVRVVSVNCEYVALASGNPYMCASNTGAGTGIYVVLVLALVFLYWVSHNAMVNHWCWWWVRSCPPYHTGRMCQWQLWCPWHLQPIQISATYMGMPVPHIHTTDAAGSCNPCRAAVRSICGCLHHHGTAHHHCEWAQHLWDKITRL